ncbi:hypothetical protein [Anaerosporobacter faecicola]|uniref:hypothetical protein n=1 Tax=Anaerosporobacter faecicola TaxID=2718714 RepID=UPI00143B7C43|nr:hypothetical protein [Anaerosporobacter faecicola]
MDKKSKILFVGVGVGVGVGGCGNNYVNIVEKNYSYDCSMVDSELEALNALKPWNKYCPEVRY